MNVELEVLALKNRVCKIQDEIQDFLDRYNESRDYTMKFLKCCEEHGIKTVAVQVSDERVPESVGFTFGNRGSVFASESENGWPAIWEATRDAGAYGGCGNSGQAQLSNRARAMLIDGCYRLENGTWMKV